MTTPTPRRDRAGHIDRGFAVLQRWGLRLIVIAASLYIVGWIVGKTWVVWFPVCIALLLAAVLAPPAKWLREHKVPAGAASGLVMVAFLTVIGGLFMVVIPQMVTEMPSIAQRAASGISKIQDWLISGPLEIREGQIVTALKAVEDWLRESAVELGTGVITTLTSAVSAIFNTVVILMLVFMILKDGHRFLPSLRRISGQRNGAHITGALSRTWETLGGFIRTQGLVSLIDAVLIGIGLIIMDVPLAVPLAVLTFIGGFIPIIGAFVTGALAVLVTLVTNSPQDALIVLLIIIAVQQLEGNILSPMLQGKSMNLHPAIVLLSVMGGGSMFGITGAFLAVPVVASIVALLRYIDEQIEAVAVEPNDDSGDETAAETSTSSAALEQAAPPAS